DCDVLNGIAYDSKNKHLLVTGKYWTNIFALELSSEP
ncbi:MAG: glutaminyl-peptide cyclotransferase, partial [Verrucomicrobiota bacterium]